MDGCCAGIFWGCSGAPSGEAATWERLQAHVWVSQERTASAAYDEDLNQSLLLWQFGPDTLRLALPQWEAEVAFAYRLEGEELVLANPDYDPTVPGTDSVSRYRLAWQGDQLLTTDSSVEASLQVRWAPLVRCG